MTNFPVYFLAEWKWGWPPENAATLKGLLWTRGTSFPAGPYVCHNMAGGMFPSDLISRVLEVYGPVSRLKALGLWGQKLADAEPPIGFISPEGILFRCKFGEHKVCAGRIMRAYGLSVIDFETTWLKADNEGIWPMRNQELTVDQKDFVGGIK